MANEFRVELDRLARSFDRAADSFPDRRRAMLEKIGTESEGYTRRGVPVETGTNPRRTPGTIREGQQKFMGSGGGYVAIRPKRGVIPDTGSRKRYRFGQVTSALEHGHVSRGGFVAGRYFYRTGKVRADQIAMKHLNELGQNLAEELNR